MFWEHNLSWNFKNRHRPYSKTVISYGNGEVDGGPELNSSVATDEFKNNGTLR